MQKFRPPLSSDECILLDTLAGLDFSTFNETDVREEYIRPLLTVLGYRKDRDYSVDTEESFKLTEPFLRIGRDRIKLDYLNAVRKQNFWFIEAKDGSAGQSAAIPDADVCQAYFYALHQSVNCRYFAVCNGWFFNLYDRVTLDAKLTPLLSVKHSEIRDRFLEIDAFIGATQVLANVKTRLIGEIEKVLSAEVTLERLEEFVGEVKAASNRVRPKVLENFRINYRRETTSHEQTFDQILERMRADQILDTFFLTAISVADIRKVSNALVSKVRASSHSNHLLLFDKLLLNTLRPVNYFFYINAVHFLLRLLDEGIENVDYHEGGGKVSVRDLLHRYLWWVLTRFEDRQDIRLLTLFEGVYARTFKRIIILMRDSRFSIEASVAFDKFIQPEEQVAARSLSPAAVMLNVVQAATHRGCAGMLGKFYDASRRSFKSALAEQELNNLFLASNDLLSRTETDYLRIRQELGTEWSELLFLDGLFSSWDPIIAAAMEMLSPREDVVRQLPSRIKKQITHVLSVGVAGGTGMKFEKAYSVPTHPAVPGEPDLTVQFFSPRYHATPDQNEEF